MLFVYLFTVVLSISIMVPAAALVRDDGEVRLLLFLFLVCVALTPYLNVLACLVAVLIVVIDLCEKNAGKVVFRLKK